MKSNSKQKNPKQNPTTTKAFAKKKKKKVYGFKPGTELAESIQ